MSFLSRFRPKVVVNAFFTALCMVSLGAFFFAMRWASTIPAPVFTPSVASGRLPSASEGSRGYIHIYDWNFEMPPERLLAMCGKSSDLAGFHFQRYPDGSESTWSTGKVAVNLPGFKNVRLDIKPGQVSGPGITGPIEDGGSHMELFELK